MAPLTNEDKILTKNSLDLNPVDYSATDWITLLFSQIIQSLQQMAYCHKISDTDQLKRVLNC